MRRGRDALRNATIGGTAVLVMLAGCTTTVRQHPEFETRRGEIRRVAVLPTEVTVVRDVLKGQDERLRELECSIAEQISRALVLELSYLGFDTQQIVIDEELLAEFPDLRFELTQLQESYDEEVGRAYATPQMSTGAAKAYQASLGPQVSPVAYVVGADALMFTRVQGYKRSAGHIAKDAVVGIVAGMYVAPEQLVLQGCLVDGVTGDVLWCNAVGQPDAEASCRDMARLLFAPMSP